MFAVCYDGPQWHASCNINTTCLWIKAFTCLVVFTGLEFEGLSSEALMKFSSGSNCLISDSKSISTVYSYLQTRGILLVRIKRVVLHCTWPIKSWQLQWSVTEFSYNDWPSMMVNPFLWRFIKTRTGDRSYSCTRYRSMRHDKLNLDIWFKAIWYNIMFTQL